MPGFVYCFSMLASGGPELWIPTRRGRSGCCSPSPTPVGCLVAAARYQHRTQLAVKQNLLRRELRRGWAPTRRALLRGLTARGPNLGSTHFCAALGQGFEHRLKLGLRQPRQWLAGAPLWAAYEADKRPKQRFSTPPPCTDGI